MFYLSIVALWGFEAAHYKASCKDIKMKFGEVSSSSNYFLENCYFGEGLY